MSSELDELRKKRLEELQRAYEQQGREQAEIQQQVGQVEAFVKAHLSREALERYGNLKIAYPDRAMQLLAVLAESIQAYNIKEINDAQLRELLQKMTPEKRDFKITRK
jgi:DNA-binding TFAR19-related protein (PDSD5 family)